VFDWLTHVQASPLTYLAVLGACALDAVLPVDLAGCLGRRRWRVPGRHRLLWAWSDRWRGGRATAVSQPQGQTPARLGRRGSGAAWRHHHRGRPLCPRRQDGDDLHRRNGAAALAEVCCCRRRGRELMGSVCGRAGVPGRRGVPAASAVWLPVRAGRGAAGCRRCRGGSAAPTARCPVWRLGCARRTVGVLRSHPGMVTRDPGTGQQPDPLVEDAQVKAEGAEPGIGKPGQPDKAPTNS